jgi:hypothetical protein
MRRRTQGQMQKVLVTDEDFQEEAKRLGLPSEGITAENFSGRLVEAERLEYANELGLPATATWREIRDARRARLQAPQDVLHISPQCRKAFAGEWLRPAQLTQDETNEILDRLPLNARRQMHKLLVVHGNAMAQIAIGHTDSIRKALNQPVNGRRFRLAKGANRAGSHCRQLWEVRPAT